MANTYPRINKAKVSPRYSKVSRRYNKNGGKPPAKEEAVVSKTSAKETVKTPAKETVKTPIKGEVVVVKPPVKEEKPPIKEEKPPIKEEKPPVKPEAESKFIAPGGTKPSISPDGGGAGLSDVGGGGFSSKVKTFSGAGGHGPGQWGTETGDTAFAGSWGNYDWSNFSPDDFGFTWDAVPAYMRSLPPKALLMMMQKKGLIRGKKKKKKKRLPQTSRA